MNIRLVSTAAALAGVVLQASAGVTYTSQMRTITARASSTAGIVEDSRTAPDFEAWNEELSVVSAGVPPAMDSTGYASQVSSLTDAGIFLSGTCSGVDGIIGQGGSGRGVSTLDAMFTISGGGDPWSLSAIGDTGINSYLIIKFERLSPSPEVLFQDHGISHDPPWSASGTLIDGIYSFSATAQGATGGSVLSARIDYDIQLTIPAPGGPAAMLSALGVIARRRR